MILGYCLTGAKMVGACGNRTHRWFLSLLAGFEDLSRRCHRGTWAMAHPPDPPKTLLHRYYLARGNGTSTSPRHRVQLGCGWGDWREDTIRPTHRHGEYRSRQRRRDLLTLAEATGRRIGAIPKLRSREYGSGPATTWLAPVPSRARQNGARCFARTRKWTRRL